MKVNTKYVDQLLGLNDPVLKSYLNTEIKGTLSDSGDSKAQMITYNEKNEAVAIYLQKDEYVLIPSCQPQQGGCTKGPGPDHWPW